MNHYLLKQQIAGAGRKSPTPPAPPPAELQPPQLGKLQALASYSYAETIDLVSDGPIEGVVNQNGQYVQGHRVFEGIYFDNTAVKKSVDVTYTGSSAISLATYSGVTGTADEIYNLWFNSGQFVETGFNQVLAFTVTGANTGLLSIPSSAYSHDKYIRNMSYFADNTNVNDPYTALTIQDVTHVGNSGNLFNCPDPWVYEKRGEITWTRDNIAKSIYRAVDEITLVANNNSSYVSGAAETAKQKLLRYNFASWNDLRDSLLPAYPSKDFVDYPIFAVKFYLGSLYSENITSECGNTIRTFESNDKAVTVASDFEIDDVTSTILRDDIANQVFQKLEISELQTAKKYRPLSYIDLTYAHKTSPTTVSIGGSVIVFGFQKNGKPTQESVQAIKDFIKSFSVIRYDNEKYNYNNVLAEIRNGEELQKPLSYFDKVYVDKTYGTKLIGPFDISNNVFRVSNFDDDTGYQLQGIIENPLGATIESEGSTDIRQSKNYSSYVGNSRSTYVEEAVPITHVIDNPSVDQVFITIGVRALSDTVSVDSKLQGIGSVQAGSKIPTAVRFKIEIGTQDSNGQEDASEIETRIYQIVGTADSAALIDIGRSENSNLTTEYKFLAGSRGSEEINASTPIILPAAEAGKKRFIRVERTTFETSSVLIRREISLEKVTEIISAKLSYPCSAIVGTKVDSRTLSEIPPRSFDLRLKRVLVPSNYYPLLPNGKDKRRYKTAADFSNAEDLQVYKGDWDGTFKIAWTDNPSWILFDLLVNQSYGLGNFVEPYQVNIWELYKIGRFCDAVNKNGVFEGVANTTGGREPRYSFNAILADKIDIFETITELAKAFRGTIFYSNSEINFTDDRVKLPVCYFSNANVKDGNFSYIGSRRDQEYNVVEISYLDENDDFKPKVEYVENSDDILKRGVLRTSLDSFGVTSQALAKRIGEHILYSTTNENESVEFVAGLEALFCKPGCLIEVSDELKTLQENFGRIVDVDHEKYILTLDGQYDETNFLPEISIYTPSGHNSFAQNLDKARNGGITYSDLYKTDVPQVSRFAVTGSDSLDYGSRVYISPASTGIEYFDRTQVGTPYAFTVSGIESEIYKVVSIKEGIVPNEYSISAIKFNTGKFAQIESGNNLDDFYSQFSFVSPPSDNTITQTLYQLDAPTITDFQTGNFDLQGDALDISGAWSTVSNATSYSVSLVRPNGLRSNIETSNTNYVFADETQAGFYRLLVTARNQESSLISQTSSTGQTIVNTDSFITPYWRTISIA